MPRERRKWTEGEDAILRDAVLKGGEGACDWHLIASCIPGRTNKDCRKRWHYKVAATVNKGPWEVAEDERLWAAVQEHGSRWALVAQVVKTRNGDQCSKRWYDALDPSIDHSPWTPEEDLRLLGAIEKHGRNWKAIVKAYFPRRTSLSAKNRYSLLIRKMEPKNKQSQNGASKKASQKPSQKPRSQVETLEASEIPSPQFRQEPSDTGTKLGEGQSRSHAYRHSLSSGSNGESLNVLFEPGCQLGNASSSGNTNGSNEKRERQQQQQQQQPVAFESPLLGQKGTPDFSGYTPPSSDCPALSPADWSGLVTNGNAGSEASFPVTTPSGQSEEMSLFFNDLHLSTSLSQGDLLQFAAKNPERMVAKSVSLDQGAMGNNWGIDFRRDATPRQSNAGQEMNDNANSRVITVMINSEVPETVNSIVNHIGREEGVSIAIHIG